MSGAGRQQGVALLMALLIVALATVAAVSVAKDQFLHARRAQNALHGDQAYVYALGVERWGLGMLMKDTRQDLAADLRMDAVTEAWSSPLPQTEVEGGSVAGRLEDLQARFNLNNLADGGAEDQLQQLAYLQRLLRVLELDPALAARIADWLDRDVDTRYPDGAEDLAYMRGDTPYRTGNTAMGDVSELLLVAGITPAVFERLAPYVTALPRRTAINVNTASAPVLRALSDRVDPQALEAAMAARQERGFRSVDGFLEALGMAAGASGAEGTGDTGGDWPEAPQAGHNPEGEAPPDTGINALITTSSDYLLVRARARVAESEVRLHSVLWRQGPRGPAVIARTRLPFDS